MRRPLSMYVSHSISMHFTINDTLCVVPCDSLVSVVGFCCRKFFRIFIIGSHDTKGVVFLAIGTLCVHKGDDKGVECVNAVGTTLAAFPSATTGIIPSATPIPGESDLISYSPSSAWRTSSAQSNCTTSPSLHITDTINATVSFNYVGM